MFASAVGLQLTLLAAVGKVRTGAILSNKISFAYVTVELPQSSVAVKVYNVVVVLPQFGSALPATNVVVTVGSHLSVKTALPLAVTQALILAVLFAPHSRIRSIGGVMMIGF